MKDLTIIARAIIGTHPMSQADLIVTFDPISRPNDLEGVWLDLERRSDCSFFQSWGWIRCWLLHLPEGLIPSVLTVSAGSEVVGLGILVARRRIRHAFVNSRSLYLNETGDPLIDSIGLEYNGFLIDRRVVEPVGRGCLEWLVEKKHGWDELNFGGLNAANTRSYAKIAGELGLAVLVRRKGRCDYVDLEVLQQDAGGYLARLSRNTRHQIRRALRLYEDDGRPSIEAARTVGEALCVLEELKELHQGYWTQRGHPGAFARGIFVRFHRNLIAKRFDAGETQLLRVSAGKKLIGYLYNFVKDGRVYAYQSGFNYDPDPRLKPGLVSHYLAIEHNLARGARVYDFMAGESQHKRSLSTHAGELTWLVLQRRLARFRLENALRSFWHRLGDRGGSSK